MPIISELSNQWGGSHQKLIAAIKQISIAGGEYVKVQLLDSNWRKDRCINNGKDYLSIDFKFLEELKEICTEEGVSLFCSPLHEDALDWCLQLELFPLKIGNGVFKSRKEILNKALNSEKPVLVSIESSELDFFSELKQDYDNVKALVTSRNYPTLLEDSPIVEYDGSIIGFSDHTVGLSACYFNLARGAKLLEKHYSLSHSWQSSMEAGHLGSMNMDQLSKLVSYERDIGIMNKNFFDNQTLLDFWV